MTQAGQTLPEGFEDAPPGLWETQVRPALGELEAERKQVIRRCFIAGGVIFGAAAIISLLLALYGDPDLIIFAFILAAVLTVGGGAAMLQGIHKKAKQALLHPVITALGYSHQEKGFEPVGFEDCRRYSLLPGHDRRDFEDWIEGEHDGARFQFYEAHLEEKRKSDKKTYYVTVFRGVIGRVQHQSSALGETVFARDGGLFDGFSAPRGMDRAGMGENEFEKIFTVWTTDQVEARYLLPPNVMEHLAAMEARFGGKKLRGAIAGGWLYFLIDTKNLFEPGSMFKPMDDPERFESLMSEIGSVRNVIKALREVRP